MDKPEGNATDMFHVNPDVPSLAYILACIVIAIIFCFGIISNVTILVVFTKTPKVRTPFNYILMNLIAAEFLSTAYGLPTDFIASMTFGWKMGKDLCLTTGFILTTVGTVTIVTLAFLSCQRFLMISDSKTFRVSTYGRCFKIILGIWAYTLPITVPPFFGFGGYVPETSGMTCAPDWASKEQTPYLMYWMVVGFLGPLFIILYFSFQTMKYLKAQTESIKNETIKRRSRKREENILRLVIWMDIAFLVSWMPYAVVCLFYIFGPSGFVHPSVAIIPLLAAKSSVCWNPLLYVGMNNQLRGAFRRWLRPHKQLEVRKTKLTKLTAVAFDENVQNIHTSDSGKSGETRRKAESSGSSWKKDLLVTAVIHKERADIKTQILSNGPKVPNGSLNEFKKSKSELQITSGDEEKQPNLNTNCVVVRKRFSSMF